MPSTDAPNAPNEDDGGVSDGEDSIELEDHEFEENLKQFSIRLQSHHLITSRLKPNITTDWLVTIKEQCTKLIELTSSTQATRVS